MDKPSDTPPGNSLYERDFFAWTQEQARAVEKGRWSDLDAANVAEELRSAGRTLQREIEDRLEILISHLLKWQRLAEYRGFAWKENIDRQRRELAEIAADNPSLAGFLRDAVADVYDDARRRLKYETYFFTTDFPATCPFTVDQVFSADYYPEELDAPATGKFPTARSIG